MTATRIPKAIATRRPRNPVGAGGSGADGGGDSVGAGGSGAGGGAGAGGSAVIDYPPRAVEGRGLSGREQ